ncbi:MAG TPA: tRNA (adenosine(37)-N6)-threonylcarbamoyltransferase complex transferase subunit TsaD, partial [Stellaceae bacterium]|nr:tRNA (adenosine(37)-N6)-threonylcarbamoyltransferase complex transferase subunit TsaD [Stellaceae bacterium]
MQILGIETSCDETAVAVVGDEAPRIRANLVLSQLSEHQRFGGIVPEVAARAHLAHLDRLAGRALAEAGVGWDGLDGIAATGGPGLIGGVMVGVMLAKSAALARGLPFLAVNHLEGHALTAR